MTVGEAKVRLQAFPDHWELEVAMTDRQGSSYFDSVSRIDAGPLKEGEQTPSSAVVLPKTR